MSTFRCGKCGCNEDTALCNYWSARVRDIMPVCSACDAKIGKWHGQFPRLFGAFLVTPSPASNAHEVLATSIRRLRQVEAGSQIKAVKHGEGVAAPGDLFYFDDPVPAYAPLMAPPEGAPASRR